jgi:Ca2+-binding RTX toxin-like protein
MTTVTGDIGNQTFLDAQVLDASLFTINTDPNVTNSATVPHVTVDAVAEGGFDYYSFTLATDAYVTFDIDDRFIDLWLQLFDADQNLVVSQDDSGILDPGSPPVTVGTDPFFSLNLTAGTYYVKVGVFSSFPDPFNPQELPGGVFYKLHISTGAPLDVVAPTFSSGATATAIDENSGANQVVYDADATDPASLGGPSNPVTYTLGAGSDAGLTIDSDDGEVHLVANPDYETTPSYSFNVVATDLAGNHTTQTVTLEIKDLDDGLPPGAYTYNGGNGNDTIQGDQHVVGDADTINGGNGNDNLSGGAGADVLSGDKGNDVLNGGAGNDVLTGGLGNDTFQFGSATGTDKVTDFKVGNDHIQLLNGLTLANTSGVVSDVNADGKNDTTLTLSDGGTVQVLGVSNVADWSTMLV